MNHHDRALPHAPEPGRPSSPRPEAVIELHELARGYHAPPPGREADRIATLDRIERWFAGVHPQDFGATDRLLTDAYVLLQQSDN